MNPTNTTLESEIITLVPPPVPKPPRAKLALPALIAALVPVPLLHTLTAAPLALVTLSEIRRSPTPLRGRVLASIALAICLIEWGALAALVGPIMLDPMHQKRTGEAFISALGDVEAMRPLVHEGVSDEHLAELDRYIAYHGRAADAQLVGMNYSGYSYSTDTGVRRRTGEYRYRVDLADGEHDLTLVIRSDADGSEVVAYRLDPRFGPTPRTARRAGDT